MDANPKTPIITTTTKKDDAREKLEAAVAQDRARAAELISKLPAQTIAQLESVVKTYGDTRKGRRAVAALLRKAAGASRIDARRKALRERERAANEAFQRNRLERRLASGLGPVVGMSEERATFLEYGSEGPLF